MVKQYEVHDEVVADEAVAHDRELRGEVGDAKRRLSSAKHRHGEAIAELNQWRWEMTVCPFGPRYSQEAYAEAVGQHQTTISKGALAWQAHLDASDSKRDASNHSGCSLGEEPHDIERPAPLTDEQVEAHDEQRRKLDAGAVKAIVIGRLAAYWGVVATTMEVNYRALVNDGLARLNAEHDTKSMDERQMIDAADAIAAEMWQEAKLRQARENAVQRWMTKNRAADNPVPIGEVRKMVDRIERRMEAREWTWDQAEADSRNWDWRRGETERSNNEMERAARIAVLELRQAAAQIKSAAIRLGKAMQKIQGDDIPITDDELTLVSNDLADADGLVRQARAAVSGDSGTNWDAALAALNQGGGA